MTNILHNIHPSVAFFITTNKY